MQADPRKGSRTRSPAPLKLPWLGASAPTSCRQGLDAYRASVASSSANSEAVYWPAGVRGALAARLPCRAEMWCGSPPRSAVPVAGAEARLAGRAPPRAAGPRDAARPELALHARLRGCGHVDPSRLFNRTL